MKKIAAEILSGDIFIYNGKENVAIDDYKSGNPYLWVTNRKYYIDPNHNENGYVYGYTNTSTIKISDNDEVEYIGNMNDVKEEELISRAPEIVKSLRLSSDCTNCGYTFGSDYCVVCGYDKGAADLIELLLNKCKTYQNEIAEKDSTIRALNKAMDVWKSRAEAYYTPMDYGYSYDYDPSDALMHYWDL